VEEGEETPPATERETEADDQADDKEATSTQRLVQARVSPARKCLATHSSDLGATHSSDCRGRLREGQASSGEASSGEANCLRQVPSVGSSDASSDVGSSDASSDCITSSQQRLLLLPRDRSGFQVPSSPPCCHILLRRSGWVVWHQVTMSMGIK